MKSQAWKRKRAALVLVLTEKLGPTQDCEEVITSYEDIIRQIWSFMARVLGDDGARAVLARSISLAAQDTPIIAKVRVREKEVDLGEFRDLVAELGCGNPEIVDALNRLGIAVFQVLSDLSGDVITGPLLQDLQK